MRDRDSPRDRATTKPPDGELPEGWTWCELQRVADMRLGKMLDASKQHSGELLHYLRNINVRWGSFDLSELLFMRFTDSEKEEFRIRDNDLLVCEGGEPGRSAVWNSGPTEIKFQKALHRIRPRSGIDPRWLMYHLQCDALSGLLDEYFTGSTIKHLTGVALKRYQFRLSPSAEQERILAKIETLLARVQATRDRLARIPAILRKYRELVLTAALTGELTSQWRNSNTLANATEDELPATWKRRSLSDVCTGFHYGTSQKSQKEGRIPVLRMGNLQAGKIDWSDLVYTDDEEDITRYLLNGNTVLFNRTNSPELVGKTAIYRGDRPAIFAGYLVRVITGNELDPEYLNYCLNSREFKEYCLRVKTDGVSQSNINAKKLSQYVMPWCPLPEQLEIVRRVDALFKLADAIDHRVSSATIRAEKLTQAILTKAFRGELVSTDAELARLEGRDYESAEELLARVRSTAEAIKPAKGKRLPTTSAQDTLMLRDKVRVTVKRKLINVLREAKGRMTPEELFRMSGCDQDDIDIFYEQLREGVETGEIAQIPKHPDPENPAVYLELSTR
jgi:type I restriction enzyme S subunit